MSPTRSASPTPWACNDHIVWIPKDRRNRLFGELRREFGQVFRDLAPQKERAIVEGHRWPEHVHLVIALPPTYAVAQGVGSIKGKHAIWSARTYSGRQRNGTGAPFWARGYDVSTVGRDDHVIRASMQQQAKQDARLAQLQLLGSRRTSPLESSVVVCVPPVGGSWNSP